MPDAKVVSDEPEGQQATALASSGGYDRPADRAPETPQGGNRAAKEKEGGQPMTRSAGQKWVIWKWCRLGPRAEGRGVWKSVAVVTLRSGVATRAEAEARAEQEAEVIRTKVEIQQYKHLSGRRLPGPCVTDGTYPQFPAQVLPGREPGSDNAYPHVLTQELPGRAQREKPRGRYVGKTMRQPKEPADANGHTAACPAVPQGLREQREYVGRGARF
jgi:hypothetical protein